MSSRVEEWLTSARRAADDVATVIGSSNFFLIQSAVPVGGKT